jgi:hypothetical protein
LGWRGALGHDLARRLLLAGHGDGHDSYILVLVLIVIVQGCRGDGWIPVDLPARGLGQIVHERSFLPLTPADFFFLAHLFDLLHDGEHGEAEQHDGSD